MTDEPDEPLTPEQETRIRSALAAARVSAPTPDHVAARLDGALADLVAERAEGRAPVVGQESGQGQQGSGRVGRRGRWLLLAGAASVAAIVALTLPSLHQGAQEMSTAGGGSAKSSASSPESLDKAAPSATPGAGALAAPVPLRRATFRSDVRTLLANRDSYSLPRVPASASSRSGADASQACAAGTSPPGVSQQRQVLLDGKPAVLEVFRTHRGTRLVRAVSCDGVETLASTRIPAR